MLSWMEAEGVNLVPEQLPLLAELRGFAQRAVANLCLPDGDAPQIEICFTDRVYLQVRVRLLQDPHHYGILFSEAAILLLRDTYYRMLAHSDCFHEVGDRAMETANAPTVATLASNIDRLVEGSPTPYKFPSAFRVPRSALRRALCAGSMPSCCATSQVSGSSSTNSVTSSRGTCA